MTTRYAPEEIISMSYRRLRAGDPLGAENALAQVWNSGAPRPPAAIHLLGLIRRAQGRFADGERLLLQSIELEPRNAEYRNNLGNLLLAAGHVEPALAAFRAALELDPGLNAARANLARALIGAERGAEALAEAERLIAAGDTAEARSLKARALAAMGQSNRALEAFDQALALDPADFVARQGRALTLARLGRFADALAAFERLEADGLNRPELHLGWGRTLMEAGRLADAEGRFLIGVGRFPQDVGLQVALAKTKWMRGETTGFTRTIEDAADRWPANVALRLSAADLLRRADAPDRAEALVRAGLSTAPDEPALLSSLGVLRDEQGAPAEAVEPLRRASQARPSDHEARGNLAHALLRAGQAQTALPEIAALRAAEPVNQTWLAYETTALRLIGDQAGYQRLTDYDRLIKAYDLSPPPGFASIEAFNAALIEKVGLLHSLDAHPLDQSLRNGSQTTKSLLESEEPLIKAFLQALDPAIRGYMQALRADPSHPLDGRNTGAYRLSGCWSVRLNPGGFHVNHLHPEGWISSAYYLALPPGVAGAADRQGWIKFGEPRWPIPGCAIERVVEPKPGRLVLFPSYMWHGTIPFAQGPHRMTIAFDVVPA